MIDVFLQSLFDLCSFPFLPLPPHAPDHLKEAIFPFYPLLLSVIVPMFPSCLVLGLPVSAEGHVLWCWLSPACAVPLSRMLFLLASPLDAAFSTWKTQRICTPAKPSHFCFCFVTLFLLCNCLLSTCLCCRPPFTPLPTLRWRAGSTSF